MPDTIPSITYNFHDFADMFVEMGALGTPSELHGLLCGQLAVGIRFNKDAWLAAVSEHLDMPTIEDEEDQTELVNWYTDTLAQLEGFDFSFTLLLPEDDDLLSERVQSLSHWCAGFLSGFGLGYDRKTQKINEDITEAMEHLAQISQVSVADWEAEDDDEDEEQNYTDVMEYVRVVVMMVFGEYNQQAEATASKVKPQLH